MASYWITFRINDDSGYGRRYDAFIEAIDKATEGWWVEPTSFFLLESNHSIDALARTISAPLRADADLFVIRDLDRQDARYFGKIESREAFLAFMPYAKKI